MAIVPAGHVGILDTLGVVSSHTLSLGFTLKSPLTRMISLSTKTQLKELQCTAPSKEGLSITMCISVLFRLDPSHAAEIYKTVGTNFEDVVFLPQLRSAIRDVTSAHEAKDLYNSSTHPAMTAQVEMMLRKKLQQRGVMIEEARFRDLQLPARLLGAIEEKLRAEQAAMQMHFVLERERAEAERKAIEAEGIQRFQKIVAQGLVTTC
ncbi:hypothetical protein HDV00_008583 [Rhizophlyctis rosea]|nr:hypothetical protein HDV00_008583 [Rhizophlyctis rosea]